jgi:hypothetical protein
MKNHPLAELFPNMEGAEFASLVEDIRAHGQVQPLVMYQGKILDGRNRARACEKIGIKPKTVDYRGTDPLGYVLSLNLARRHLNESQRAMVAARVSEWSSAGGDRRSADQAANLPNGPTQAEAAQKLNVSERSVRNARKVVEHGTSALKKSVERGEMPVSTAAKLAEAPAKTQKAAVDGGAAVAREIVEKIAEKKAAIANENKGGSPEEPTPVVRMLGLEAPPEMLVRIEKEQGLIDKMDRLLSELKRTFTEYEGIKCVVGKLGRGKHYSSALRDALEQLNLLRKQRPASLCPHCKLLPELQPTCNVCRSSGYVGEEALGSVEKCLLAEGDDAGVWVNGKWRTMASMRGDDF